MPVRESYPDPYSNPGDIPLTNPQTEPEPSATQTIGTDEISSWWKKIDESDRLRREQVEQTLRKAVDYVKGKHFPENREDTVVINYIASTIWIIKNYVYAVTPEFKITGKNPIGEMTAPFAEMGLNYYTKEGETDDENEQVIVDGLLAGDGVTLDCMSTEISYARTPKKEDQYPDVNSKGEIKAGEDGTSEDSQKRAEQFEMAEYIKSAMPVTFRISPYDVLRDPEAKGIKTSRWFGRWVRKKLLSEVIENPIYDKEAKSKLEQAFGGVKGKVVDLAEIQVKKHINGELVIYRLVLCDADKTLALLWDKEPYQVEGFNYNIFTPKKLGDDPIGLSEFLAYKPIQDLINQVHSKIWEQISKSGMQTAIVESYLTKQGKKAIKDGEGIILLAKGTMDARQAVAQVETSKVNPDTWRYEQISRDIFRVVSGIGEAMRAGTQQGGTNTLGELQLIQGGTNVVLSGFAKELRKFLIKQARKKLQLMRQLPVQSFIPIAGYKDKIPKEFVEGNFLKFSKDFIIGEYDVDIDINTLRAQDSIQERSSIKDMILTALQAKQQLAEEGKRVLISKLFKDYLKTYNKFTVDEYIEDMNLRDADTENMGFLLMEKTGQIVPVMVQEGENKTEHLQKHIAFAGGPLKSIMGPQIFDALLKHIQATEQEIANEKQMLHQSINPVKGVSNASR